MKKKILALVLVAAMLGVALIGGTLAYFTDKEVEDNEFVIGDIDIELKESNGADAVDEAYKDWLADQTLFPGAPIAKNVWVENAGDNEAYLRVKITVPEYLVAVWAQGMDAAWTIASTTVNADGSTTYVLTYNEILPPYDANDSEAHITPICLEAITIDPFTDKPINGADIQTVNVVAEAIQTVGFADAAEAFAALDAQLIVNEYEGKNYVQAADATALAAALAGAQPGDVIALAAGVDYGTVALNGLDNVTIVGAAGANALFNIADGAQLGEVTLAEFDFNVTAAAGAVQIAQTASVEMLTIDGCSFVGTGSNKAMTLQGGNVNVTITDTTVESVKYAVYGYSNTDSLTIENCHFTGMTSWVVLVNNNAGDSATAYDLVVKNTTFTKCVKGLIKSNYGANSVVFVDNVVDECAGHDGLESKWFTLDDTPADAITVSGNTFDGADWTPGAAQGLGK